MNTEGFFVWWATISIITCYLLSVLNHIVFSPDEERLSFTAIAISALLWPMGLAVSMKELWKLMRQTRGEGKLHHTIAFPAQVGDIVVVSEESEKNSFRKVGIIDWMEVDVWVRTRTSPEGRTNNIRLHLHTLEGDDKFNLAVSKNTQVRILKQE